jgi:hypothetical protein
MTNAELIRKVNRHTHICAGCFGYWQLNPKTMRRKLCRKNFLEALQNPRDTQPFVKKNRMWYHTSCWKWLQEFEKEMKATYE